MEDLTFAWPEPERADTFDDYVESESTPEFLGATDGADDWDREVLELHEQLATAERTIAQLEADRHTARLRIEQLEAAEERAQAVITQQRRRLLVLERQVEDIRPPLDADLPLSAVPGGSAKASWLDRLLGGTAPAPSPSREAVDA